MKLKLSILLWAMFAAVSAQQKPVTTSIDKTKNKIGAQFSLTLKTTADSSAAVIFPKGKNFGKLEVIRSFKIDTVRKGGRFELVKKYGLTQFDSGKYTIPRLPVLINNKPFMTDSITVEVANVKVDTLKQKMYDIKDIINTGDKTSNWWKYLLAVIVLCAAAYGTYHFIKKRQLAKGEAEKFRTPIEKAAVLLQQLEKKELWQKGEIKNYYSELTDIARNYIEEAIHIPAMESTTSELIVALRSAAVKKNMSLSQETVENLEKVLKHADLVKFAKSQPPESEIADDRRKLEKSIFTLDEAIPEASEDETAFNELQKQKLLRRQKRNRIIITVGVVVFLCIATTIYFIVTRGFDFVKDNIIGHPTKELLEGEWVMSEYGTPAIVVETPRVLKRVDAEKYIPGAANTFKSRQVFRYGSLLETFNVMVMNATFASETPVNLDNITEQLTAGLTAQGAMNVVLKKESFDIKGGISGVKVFGTFTVKDPAGKESKKIAYQDLVFAEQNGLQQVMVTHEDGDQYGEEIAKRIAGSVEIKTAGE